MLTYEDVRDYLKNGLSQVGYSDVLPLADKQAMPLFDVGPTSIEQLKSLSTEAIVFLSLGGGSGLTAEGLFDGLFINVLVIGPQGDYSAAERLALAVDYVFLQVAGNTQIGGAQVLYINRSGGRPSLSDRDDGDRYHFTGSYITEASSDLVR